MIEQVAQLRRRDRYRFTGSRWPDKPSSLEPFCEQACSLAIVPDHLHKIAAAISEDEQMSAERVFAKHLLHLERQRGKASAHFRVAYREPHSRACREPGSSAHQSTEKATQRVSINVAIDPDAMSATKIDFDDALALPSTGRRLRQWRFGDIPRRHTRPNLDRY